jgi:hypothetical protein
MKESIMGRTHLFVAAFCAFTVSTAAIAGEVNGSTKNPREDYSRGVSWCKFSGLNDDPDSTNPMNPPGHTQNFGQLVANYGFDPQEVNPGTECNPTRHPLPDELLNRP